MSTRTSERMITQRLHEVEDWGPIMTITITLWTLSPIEGGRVLDELNAWRRTTVHPTPDIRLTGFYAPSGSENTDRVRFNVEAKRPLDKSDLDSILKFMSGAISKWVGRTISVLRYDDVTITNVPYGAYKR